MNFETWYDNNKEVLTQYTKAAQLKLAWLAGQKEVRRDSLKRLVEMIKKVEEKLGDE